MFDDRFAQLMALQLAGEATEQEVLELREYLTANPQAQYFYEIFSDYWVLTPQNTEDDIQEEIHFQQIIAIAETEAETSEPVPGTLPDEAPARVITLKRFLVAAAVITVMVATYFLYPNSRKAASGRIAVNEVVAKPGARTELRLPDGTKVWLNSESKLEYKGNFNDSIREVNLEGEAYFDVVKDKSRPFIVHTSDIDIRVLGTAFNVKSYPRESSIEATLIHGLIEVTNKKEPTSPKVILHPHEKLIFSKDAPLKPVVDDVQKSVASHKPFAITALPRNIADTAVVETSWVYKKLVFDGETFREIALKMERWYNVTITFRSEKVANVPIHVEFKDESVEEALEALRLIEPFNYKINGSQIEILKK